MPSAMEIPPAIALKPLVSEIALLLDFLTSRSGNSYRDNATAKLPVGCATYSVMLCKFIQIADLVLRDQPIDCGQVSFLLEMLDYLGSLTNPVSSDSIAFSVLVGDELADEHRSAWRCSFLPRWRSAGSTADAVPVAVNGAVLVNGAVMDARTAFPSYVPIARRTVVQHSFYRCLLLLTLLFVAALSFDLYGMSSSIKVLAEFKYETEIALGKILAKDKKYCPSKDPLKYYAIDNKIPLDEEQHYICMSWFELINKRDKADLSLDTAVKQSFTCSWFGVILCRDLRHYPLAVTTSAPPDKRLEDGTPGAGSSDKPAKISGAPPNPDQPATAQSGKDAYITDQSAATVVAKITFFLLAPVMGLLGALISVVRSHVNDVRERLMTPRSSHAMQVRVILGISAGVVLLYFNAPDSEQAQGLRELIDVTKLTIPAIAFLVGASADFVFGKLESLTAGLFKREPR